MRSKKIGDKYILRLDKGEEIMESLKQFCQANSIKLAYIHGLGATNKANVGLYDMEKKEYHSKEFTGNFEISSLYGNITTMDGEVYLHVHINLCDTEHRSFGGHLNTAVISATFEGVVEVMDGEIDRQFDENVNLNLLKI